MFNILVIEDNKNMRKLICATLKQNGYSTFEAEDGEVGLDVLDTTHIDLIICDIMMPNMDGYEFTETLRDGHCETPIIIVTAKEQLEDKKKEELPSVCEYHGVLKAAEVPAAVCTMDYGLVWDGTGKDEIEGGLGEYLKYNNSHK